MKFEQAFGLLKGLWQRLNFDKAKIEWLPVLDVAACFIHNIYILDENSVEDFMKPDLYAEDAEDDDLQPSATPRRWSSARRLFDDDHGSASVDCFFVCWLPLPVFWLLFLAVCFL